MPQVTGEDSAAQSQSDSRSVARTSPERSIRHAIRSACETCRSRKIKCTGERPNCARCVRLKKNCVYTGSARSGAAEARIAELEAQVRLLESAGTATTVPFDSLGQITSSSEDFDMSMTGFSPSAFQHTPSPRNNLNTQANNAIITNSSNPSNNNVSSNRNNSLVNVNGSNSNQTFNAQSIHPAPVNSTYMPTSVVSGQSHVSPENNQEVRVDLGYPKPHNRPLPSNSQLFHQISTGFDVTGIVKEVPPPASREAHAQVPVQIDKRALPPDHVVIELLQHFIAYTSAAFPIFHVPTLRNLVDNVCFKQRLVEAEQVCAVILVLAVSATSIPGNPVMSEMKTLARNLWEYGQKFLPPVFLPPIDETRGLLRVQVMLIRLQYVLYNPNAGNVWGLSGAAVRASVDLGFHHEWKSRGHGAGSVIELDLRRRVFWISYTIDRDLCMALGRPPAISDEWITAELPSNMDDSLLLPNEILNGQPAQSKLTAIHLIHIRKIQSKIHAKLYVPSGASEPPTPDWFREIEHTLDVWKTTAPAGTGFCSDEWLDLCHHMTVTLLHRPSPGNPSPPRDALKKALDGSASTMRVYKEMYRKGRIDFNWLSMYHLFMAGVTYLNSLWQAHRNGWTIVPSYVGALLDIHVCSSVMEALAAITPGTSAIRDTFEAVSERIIRQLSANARWDSLSRPPSPGQLQDGLSAGMNDFNPASMWVNGTNFGGDDPIMGIANPFDSFLLHPLGEMSGNDWGRALSNVFEFPVQEDYSNMANMSNMGTQL